MSAPIGKPGPVVEGRRKRRMGAGVGCLVLLGLTLGGVGHVAVQARQLEVALALGAEQKLNQELLERKRRLQNEIGRLKNPGLIVNVARDKLEMAPPLPENIRPLKPPAAVEAKPAARRGQR
jgi:hypothetical protein